MKLTDVVTVWGLLPNNIEERDCSDEDLENTFDFEDFVNAIHEVVGVEMDVAGFRRAIG